MAKANKVIPKEVNSMEELMIELQKYALAAMEEVSGLAVEKVKERLKEDVYDAYTPKSYVRTGQLMKSVNDVVTQDGLTTHAVIEHFAQLMEPVAPYAGNNYMGQHYSTDQNYNPQEYSQYVAQTVNDGTSGHIFGQGAWTKPRPYFTEAETYMTRNFKKLFKESLSSQGLSVS